LNLLAPRRIHAKYQCIPASGSREDDFWRFIKFCLILDKKIIICNTNFHQWWYLSLFLNNRSTKLHPTIFTLKIFDALKEQWRITAHISLTLHLRNREK